MEHTFIIHIFVYALWKLFLIYRLLRWTRVLLIRLLNWIASVHDCSRITMVTIYFKLFKSSAIFKIKNNFDLTPLFYAVSVRYQLYIRLKPSAHDSIIFKCLISYCQISNYNKIYIRKVIYTIITLLMP